MVTGLLSCPRGYMLWYFQIKSMQVKGTQSVTMFSSFGTFIKYSVVLNLVFLFCMTFIHLIPLHGNVKIDCKIFVTRVTNQKICYYD